MISPIKRFVRPVVCPVYHGWQWFHDYSRGKLREFRDHRRILNDGTTILKDVHGVRFVLYPWDRPHLLELEGRVYDQAEFQAIPRLVKPGDIAFDVGANVGVYSVLLSRLCGPSGHVWAFEPVHRYLLEASRNPRVKSLCQRFPHGKRRLRQRRHCTNESI